MQRIKRDGHGTKQALEVNMASGYTGLFLIGDKAANRITHVQVVNTDGNSIPLPLADYVARGIQPDYKTLPWRENPL
jgi:hypothetical protein